MTATRVYIHRRSEQTAPKAVARKRTNTVQTNAGTPLLLSTILVEYLKRSGEWRKAA